MNEVVTVTQPVPTAAVAADLRELWRHILKGARKGRQKSRTNTLDRLRDLWLNPPATQLP